MDPTGTGLLLTCRLFCQSNNQTRPVLGWFFSTFAGVNVRKPSVRISITMAVCDVQCRLDVGSTTTTTKDIRIRQPHIICLVHVVLNVDCCKTSRIGTTSSVAAAERAASVAMHRGS
ncbi:unnamed protein product [Symbiodinium necroappetens]|uniref:Uncharacterized protein n=1 Tax=Symbiodinium necroappetens TaxID=1628268 RepID=A0A813A410_9DINO|nr:unnamed protein product [Symbiodinium necroappetens]